MKATGRDLQITRQIGEHLVVAELGRRGYVAAPFAGNVPMFDLLAADVHGFAFPVQVKTIRGHAWQFSADRFLRIEMIDGEQSVHGRVPLVNPDLICVFVMIKDGGKDEFYILSLRDLQNHFARTYKGGRRPRKPESMHCTIVPEEIEKFRDNWGLVESTVAAQRKAKRKR
jgi:hypothetical protein